MLKLAASNAAHFPAFDHSGDDSGAYTCIDYLVACTEYSAFLQLMGDFCAMSSWDVDGGADGALGGCLE